MIIAMRTKIFQLHRTLSIIIAIPVLLWASSGFMHPIMTNIRPAIATQGIIPVAIDTARIRYPLVRALKDHHLDSLSNFRLVHIDTNWFYQVQPLGGRGSAVGVRGLNGRLVVPIYISCTNGNILTAGDWLYAQYLARQFLEGGVPYKYSGGARSPGDLIVQTAAHTIHDCCGAATEAVLNPVKGAKVFNVSMVSHYDNEYKSINRLLPVYRVSFERADGIRVYVETTQDRFSFAMDNRRAVFDEIFRLCHTWGWLDFLGKGRMAVEVLVALTALFTAVLGIYIFFTTGGAGARGARRNHRYTAITASLFTLLWTFSGSYHAFSKFSDDVRDNYAMNARLGAGATDFDLAKLQAVCTRPVVNISMVVMAGEPYWQASMLPERVDQHKDLMKEQKAALPPVAYVRARDYTALKDGDARYAAWMATLFSGYPEGEIRKVEPITSFGDEYNFTDKRLPVWKVSYDRDRHVRYYVETGSGRLSSRVDDRIAAEGYSFSVFHKHHFMDWGGKTVRDVSTMVWAFAQILMVIVGLIFWFKKQKSLRS
ncbi:MAG TPA: PepSY domain-containing protein [Puia sp.]|nr:PepSY domain-containing protein [Puia sp.]